MSHLRQNWRPGDRMYVYTGARLPFAFYSGDYGFRGGDYQVGHDFQDDSRCHFQELDMFRGRPRVWVVLTQATYPQRDDILHYLDTIGVIAMPCCAIAYRKQLEVPASREAVLIRPHTSEAFLYDLSDPLRLGDATAASIW